MYNINNIFSFDRKQWRSLLFLFKKGISKLFHNYKKNCKKKRKKENSPVDRDTSQGRGARRSFDRASWFLLPSHLQCILLLLAIDVELVLWAVSKQRESVAILQVGKTPPNEKP